MTKTRPISRPHSPETSYARAAAPGRGRIAKRTVGPHHKVPVPRAASVGAARKAMEAKIVPASYAATAEDVTGMGLEANIVSLAGEGKIKIYHNSGGKGPNSLLHVDKLENNDADKLAAEEAFKTLKEAFREVYDVERMTVSMGDNCITVHLALVGGKEETKTLWQLKNEIALKRAGGNQGVAKKLLPGLDEELGELVETCNYAIKRSGLSMTTCRSKGPDIRESKAHGKALTVGRHSAPLIQHKQAISLSEDVKKERFNIFKSLEIIQPAKRKEAAAQMLRSEARAIHLRDKLAEAVEKLTEQHQANPKKETELQLEQYNKLLVELRTISRDALWATAMHTDPKECFQMVLFDYFNEYYDGEKNRPSFGEFVRSSISAPFRARAAEIASTLITSPVEYALFCEAYGIDPKENHINVFLNQLPRNIDFSLIGIDSPVPELVKFVEASVKASEIPDAQIAGFGAADGKDLIQAALKDKVLGPLLVDKFDPPSRIDRLAKWLGLKK